MENHYFFLSLTVAQSSSRFKWTDWYVSNYPLPSQLPNYMGALWLPKDEQIGVQLIIICESPN